jgi:hypothetical protein
MQHGMAWVGLNELPTEDGVNRLSSYAGVMGQARQEEPEVAPNRADKLTAESLGRRVAQAAQRWNQRVAAADSPVLREARPVDGGVLAAA